MKFLRRKEVEKITGLSRSSIYQYMSAGGFPRSHKVGRRAVAWLESEVHRWMEERCTGDESESFL